MKFPKATWKTAILAGIVCGASATVGGLAIHRIGATGILGALFD